MRKHIPQQSVAETLAAIKLIRARGRASRSMLAVCDMLEYRLKEEDGKAPKFDRAAYQRQYMRDRRAAAKVGITTQDYRNRNGR
jgi:hypothetical protein